MPDKRAAGSDLPNSSGSASSATNSHDDAGGGGDSVRPNFSWDVQFGQILQMLVVAAGVGLYIISASGKADEAVRKVTETNTKLEKLEAGMTIANDNLRNEFNRGLTGIQNQIAQFPDVRAELVQMRRQFDSAETDRQRNQAGFDARLRVTEQTSIQNSADIANIKAGSAVTLGRGRQ